jgi:hypothetical protein
VAVHGSLQPGAQQPGAVLSDQVIPRAWAEDRGAVDEHDALEIGASGAGIEECLDAAAQLVPCRVRVVGAVGELLADQPQGQLAGDGLHDRPGQVALTTSTGRRLRRAPRLPASRALEESGSQA